MDYFRFLEQASTHFDTSFFKSLQISSWKLQRIAKACASWRRSRASGPLEEGSDAAMAGATTGVWCERANVPPVAEEIPPTGRKIISSCWPQSFRIAGKRPVEWGPHDFGTMEPTGKIPMFKAPVKGRRREYRKSRSTGRPSPTLTAQATAPRRVDASRASRTGPKQCR
jgi:hypothetical protein